MEHQPSKRRKLEIMEEPNCIEMNTKITDINIDCLEKIFKHLGLVDLLNVADSNSYLKIAAEMVYSSKFDRVQITNMKLCQKRTMFDSENCSDIKVSDLKISLQLLRCFGHLIKKLEINLQEFKCCSVSFNHLTTYINEYSCALTDIGFIKNYHLQLELDGALDKLMKPFPSVKNVHIDGFRCKENFLTKLFPKMRKLCVSISNEHIEFIAHHFPHLKNLSITLNRIYVSNPICHRIVPHINSVLSLNQQIRTLDVSFFLDNAFLQAISQLQFLETLTFAQAPVNFFNFSGHFKNLKILKFICDIERTESKSEEMPSFEQLEEIHVTGYEYDQFSDDFYQFIGQNTSIVKFRVCFFNFIMDTQKLSIALPMLKEIYLDCNFYGFYDPADFIAAFKSLEKYSFRIGADTFADKELRILHTRLLNKWHATVCGSELFNSDILTLNKKFEIF